MEMMRPMPVSPSLQRSPQITQPAPYVACVGDIATFSLTATSANSFTYQWQVSTNGTSAWKNIVDGIPSPYTNSKTATLSISPAAIGLSTNRYHCILSNLDGSTTSNSALLTVNNCTISGTLKYNNANFDILPGMTVKVNGKSAVVQPTTGTYTITGVTSGLQNVTVTPGNSNYPECVNATDAGAANYWSTRISPIAHVKYLAGDVNADNAIDAMDVQSIQHYFVLGQPYARAPWSFWNAQGNIAANSDPVNTNPITVSVNGTSVTLDLLGMITGDFNGSLNPLAVKSTGAKIQLMYGDTRKLNPNQEFELSLRATSSMEAGAVSLILNIPADLVEVKDAYMKGRNDKPVFNVKGNELRIGWNSLTPVNLEATEDLIILKLKTTSAFTEGKMIKIKLDTNSMNEIANDNFTVIPQIALNTDVLIGVNPGLLTLSGYPNPFSEYTTLSYTLPADANVTLRIYNLLGMLVQNLVNEHQSVATYTVNLDASKMQQGTYTAILRINDNIKIMERTIKLVVNR